MPQSRPAGRIHRLSATLANQIAAGEVVERPASVVKELLENALDAGARRIEVETRAGGVALIRVRDDGCGIHADDLVLALDRHATSKIRAFQDLVRVRSMGFRGEALPSIGSVSRLELASCAAGADAGWRVRVAGGELLAAPEPCAHPPGTTVEVRDLFYNTPARRKFLRTERTELRHLDEVVRRVALSCSDLALSLRHGERALWSVTAARGAEGDRRRLGALCGRAFADAALAVDVEATGLRLAGWLAPPGAGRAHADLQLFFVNGRAVGDAVARHAVRQALDGLLEPGRHPAYVLFLELDPAQVDVNVHPAKHEVRYREARLVHDFVSRSLRRELLGQGSGGHGLHTHGSSTPEAHPGRALQRSGASSPESVAETVAAYAELHRGQDTPAMPGGVLGVGGRFAALVVAGGLRIVDLARARRPWLREHAADAVRGGEIVSRPLLVPVSREVDEVLADRFESALDALAQAGVDVRRTGPRTISLRRVPALLAGADPQAFLDALGAVLGPVLDPVLDPDELASLEATLLERIVERIDLTSWRVEPGETTRMLAALGESTGASDASLNLDEAALARLFEQRR
jgi:DNA mismatch repair protein MutL